MKKHAANPKDCQSLVNAMDKLIAMIESEKILSTPAQLSACSDCQGRWTYMPVRRTFEFSNIAGSLEDLELP